MTVAEQIRRHAREIEAAFSAPIGVLDDCAEELRQGFDDNFSRGGNSEGPWPPHSPVTVAIHGPHPLLILSGAMRAATTEQGAPGAIEQIGPRGLDMSIDLQQIPYARAQNLGHNRIPQREFHVVDESRADACEKLIAADVAGRLSRG